MKIIRPENFNVIWGGGGAAPAKLRNCQETNSPELFGVIGIGRDLRLFYVELRTIYVTPKKRILR